MDDGSASTDYDEEEIARKMSLAASRAHTLGKTKILSIRRASTCLHEGKLYR